jgi:hypothetical protein
MTTKLTLTIEDSVIHSAKKYARKNGKSLSAVVENYLKSISANENTQGEISSRVLKLMGSITLPKDFDYKKELGGALAKRYKK